MLKNIVEARAIGETQIYIRFEDGVAGEIGLAKLIEFKGVFAPLQNPEELAKVTVGPELGTVCWPHGADLDPNVLYATLTGQPIDLQESALVH